MNKSRVKTFIEGTRFFAYLVVLLFLYILEGIATPLPYLILKLKILTELLNGKPKPARSDSNESAEAKGTCKQ